jgi:hypothetical protein
MQKANIPGKRRRRSPEKEPFLAVRAPIPAMILAGPSTGSAMMVRDTNMIGVRKNMVANGLEVAGWRRRRIWVKAQRKPEKKAEEMIRTKPRASKAVSPATIMITPAVMVAIMRMSFHDGASSRKTKAKRSTKAKAEDLHIV